MRFDPKEPGRNILLHGNGLSFQNRGLISGRLFPADPCTKSDPASPDSESRHPVQQYDRIIPELVYNKRLLLRPVRIKESFL